MNPVEWLHMQTTYGPTHEMYVAQLYHDLYASLSSTFLMKSEMDDSDRFTRLVNILFKHSAVFAPYR